MHVTVEVKVCVSLSPFPGLPIIQFCILQAIKSRTTTRPKNKTNVSIALIKMLQIQCLLALFWGRAMNKGNT